VPSRSLAKLIWGNLAAQSAEQTAIAAALIVAVLALGGGAGATGLIQAAQTLPFLLFAIPAGVLADRLSRRALLIGAEALRAAALLGILALLGLDLLTWPLLALLGLLAGCSTVVYSVAAPSIVPALVPRQALGMANSRIELARTVAFAAGPALGGALIGWAGSAAAFAFAAALSVCALGLLAGLDEPHRPATAPRRLREEIRDGARFVFHDPLLRPIFATTFVFNLSMFVLLSAFVPYAVRSLGLSSQVVGAVLGTYGAGMVVGALLARVVLRSIPFGVVVAIGPVCGLVAALVMTLTIVLPWPALAAASFFLFGAGPILWVISTTTLRQMITPPELLGRAAAINILAQGGRPIGAALGALIGAIYGAETCLVVAAIGFAVQAALILFSPVPRFSAASPAARGRS
jgi:predicted MFS family arabinose efflux permease